MTVLLRICVTLAISYSPSLGLCFLFCKMVIMILVVLFVCGSDETGALRVLHNKQ